MTSERRIAVLYPTSFNGFGPNHSCERLSAGLAASGADVVLFGNRFRVKPQVSQVFQPMSWPMRFLPFKHTQRHATRLIEVLFEKKTSADDVCFVWPGVSREFLERLKARGNPIVLESINTPMTLARKILDELYESLGVAPTHGITDERVDDLLQRYQLADEIFCPSEMAEKGLTGTPLEGRGLATSYGAVYHPDPPPDRGGRASDRRIIFLFVGYACVRKGVHILLDIWRDMPADFTLRIVGEIEPVIADLFRDVLSGDQVQSVGFSNRVDKHMADADVFVMPSFEEGGPLVTHEAADAALPLVVSPAGGGRLHSETGRGVSFDPHDSDGLKDLLLRLGASKDERLHHGRRAREVAPDYDWNKVAARRHRLLVERFGGAEMPKGAE